MATAEHTRPTLAGARWSMASRCPRMAALHASGVMPEPLPDRVHGLWERGHDVEDAWVRRLRETYTGPIIREHAIPWGPGWEAHVDVLLPDDDRKHIEVKSTTTPDSLPGCPVDIANVKTTSAVVQVVGGAAFDPEGGTAEIVAVSPVDYRERRYPIQLTDDLVGIAQEIGQRVISANRTGQLPSRTCQTPADGVGKFCPHIGSCFEGWQPEDPIQLHDEVATLATALVDVDGQLRVLTDREKELKAQRDTIRDELRGWLAPGKTYQVDGVELKRIEVKGRETFSLKDALAAGAVTAQQCEPFIRHGQPSERWTASIIDQEGES